MTKFVGALTFEWEIDDALLKEAYDGITDPIKCAEIEHKQATEVLDPIEWLDVAEPTVTGFRIVAKIDKAEASMRLQQLLLDFGAEIREVENG